MALTALALAAPASFGEQRALERVSTGPAGGNGAFPVSDGTVTRDGRCVVFGTDEQLTPDDTDSQFDGYRRCGSSLERVTQGPLGGNDAQGATVSSVSADGSCVLFETFEVMTADDTDTRSDIYKRCGSTTERVSQGDNGGNGAFAAGTYAISPDGACAVFSTSEQLLSEDTDTQDDIYRRCGSTTSRISAGATSASGNGAFPAYVEGISRDGACIAFRTTEQLLADDTDAYQDIYTRCGSSIERSSQGPAGGNGPKHATLGFNGGISDDGGCVIIETAEALTADDGDTAADVYRRCGTTTELISAGTTTYSAGFGGMSSDAGCVAFFTREPLSGDTDSARDIYVRCGSTTSRVSTGPNGGNAEIDTDLNGISADGACVVLNTTESLTADDTDASWDVYRRCGGTTTLLSRGGNGAFDAFPSGMSRDLTRVFIDTDEPLTSDDTDSRVDVYEEAGGALTRISGTGSSGNGDSESGLSSVSDDGQVAALYSPDALAPGDTDGEDDLYASRVGPAGGGGGADGGSGANPGTNPLPVTGRPDTTPPAIQALSLSNRRFAVAPVATAVAARARRGTTIRYTTSEAGTATIAIQRVLPGRRKGRRCVKPSSKLRKAKRCTRYTRAGTLTRQAVSGANAVRFSGRIGRKALRPGSYRLVVTVRDGAGNLSAARAASFTIVRK